MVFSQFQAFKIKKEKPNNCCILVKMFDKMKTWLTFLFNISELSVKWKVLIFCNSC